MSCFKSLLYREFRISRKSNILRICLSFGFLLFFWLIMVSIKNDEVINESVMNDNIKFVKVLPVATAFFITYFMSLANTQGNNHKADVNSRWTQYSYTLPVTPFMRAAALSAYRLIFFGAGIVISFVNAMVSAAYWDFSINESALVYPFLISAFIIFFTLPLDFFIFRAKNSIEYKKASTRGNASMVTLVILTVIVLLKSAGFSLSNILNSEKDNTITLPDFNATNLIWAIPLFIIMELVSFTVLFHSFKLPYASEKEEAKTVQKNDPHSSISETGKFSPKGLIYMELSANVLTVLICALLPFICALLPFIACASDVFFGNKSVSDMFEIAANPFVLIAMYLLAAAGMCMTTGLLFKNDAKKLFAYFIAATPKGVKGYVRNKYLFCVVLNILFHAGCLVSYAVLSAAYHNVTDGKMPSPAKFLTYALFFVLFVFALDLVLFFRFGMKKASMIRLLLLVGSAITGTIIFCFLPESARETIMIGINDLMHGEISGKAKSFMKFTPVLFIFCYLGSMKLSRLFYIKGAESGTE